MTSASPSRSVLRNSSIRIFFFQAEDGIRDYKVTGVQTCALPISAGNDRAAAVHEHPRAGGFGLRDEVLDPQLRRGRDDRAEVLAGNHLPRLVAHRDRKSVV